MNFSKDEMLKILPVILRDLKHHSEITQREPTNKNISRDMYHHVIRTLYSSNRFLCNEKINDGSCREGLFIKGYVRDVWSYLEEAYDLIHNTDFEELIKPQSTDKKLKLYIHLKLKKRP